MFGLSKVFQQIMDGAISHARKQRHEFLTPEHLMLRIISNIDCVAMTFKYAGIEKSKLLAFLKNHLATLEKVPGKHKYEIDFSNNLLTAFALAGTILNGFNKSNIGLFEIIYAILNIDKECPIRDFVVSNIKIPLKELLGRLITEIAFIDPIPQLENSGSAGDHGEDDGDDDDDEGSGIDPDDSLFQQGEYSEQNSKDNDDSIDWQSYATRINDSYKNHNPLIGRAYELERTVHILKKKDRHNVLYIGESGVGKTAMVYGLLRALAEDKALANQSIAKADFFQIDMTAVLAGSQFRGDFEKKVKAIMEGISQSRSAVVYIDDIHTLVGMGNNSENSNDASQMLLKYMDRDNIRFIGTTTFQEYSRHFQKNKAMDRRFQAIEIAEPSASEAAQILEALLPIYEKYHGVSYRRKSDIARLAVEMSQKYISGRHLPEKAIDLIDEAGAFRAIHPLPPTGKRKPTQWVDKDLIAQMVQKACRLSNMPDLDDSQETKALQNLESRIRAQIFGQDEAVSNVVECIQMSKAGLMDFQKPIASLLFVGQTGVGKTEIAKVLAKELGLELLRFDMSEYAEKHTVAKLIGSPAGYVGYDDGGLLTDAIRKSPSCVLLLDEIEKAHSDIYNILLQIMDYASLTDNKGQKADFRHVILIMTSNAGAQYAHQATIGFSGSSAGSAMMTAVKKTFKPEFINRLSATVLFNDMSKDMASMILSKKIEELRLRLQSRSIELEISQAASQELLSQGFSQQYGAREIDRVINRMLNPPLMREILFGKLKKGGKAKVDFDNGKIVIE